MNNYHSETTGVPVPIAEQESRLVSRAYDLIWQLRDQYHSREKHPGPVTDCSHYYCEEALRVGAGLCDFAKGVRR